MLDFLPAAKLLALELDLLLLHILWEDRINF